MKSGSLAGARVASPETTGNDKGTADKEEDEEEEAVPAAGSVLCQSPEIAGTDSPPREVK